MIVGYGGLIGLVVIVILSSLKIVKEYERGVKFTLGRFTGIMKPGLRLVIPVIQTWQKVDMRIKAVDVASQEAVSRDNVSLKVNAVLYYKVNNADKAILEVEHFGFAVSHLYGNYKCRGFNHQLPIRSIR